MEAAEWGDFVFENKEILMNHVDTTIKVLRKNKLLQFYLIIMFIS